MARSGSGSDTSEAPNGGLDPHLGAIAQRADKQLVEPRHAEYVRLSLWAHADEATIQQLDILAAEHAEQNEAIVLCTAQRPDLLRWHDGILPEGHDAKGSACARPLHRQWIRGHVNCRRAPFNRPRFERRLQTAAARRFP